MKKLSIFVSLFSLLALSTACSDDSLQPLTNVQPVIDAATSGTWRISNYADSGTNHTSHFNGYSFTFGSGNVVSASNGTNTYTGTWSVTNSSGSDDSHHDDDSHYNDIDFNIFFTSPANFVELSDDWDIVSYSATRIELIDVSGGNGGTDILVLEKI
jgi:hypothetical protein